MDEHFRAFSFVDRITSVRPGVEIRGRYTIPPGLETFPGALVAEAVGQLAAWSAMAAMNFERRPVAGLAGSIELLSPVRPGQILDLAAELETTEADAAAYGGTAEVDGIPVVRLRHCVGPMVLQEDFDDPQALRERFALLCGAGATPGAFGGIPAFSLNRINGEPGQCARATLQVPPSAPLFADHFPRRPVFPGTLLMHLNLQLATALAAEMAPAANGSRWVAQTIQDVKLRSFTPPGEMLDLEVKVSERSENSATLVMEIRRGKRLTGGARILLSPEKETR